jgi:hypothetical protein
MFTFISKILIYKRRTMHEILNREIVPTTPSPLHFYSHPQSKHHYLSFTYFHSVSVRDGWHEKVLWVMRIAQLSHGERNRKMCHLRGINKAPFMEQIAESHGPQCHIPFLIIIQFNLYKQSLTKQVPFNCFSPFTPRVPDA